ncbi:MAG: DUF1266 domain-containing protein [Paludibacter sp.]|jgi:hypothetical protein|nr:DUF1266 domain-containing protein [Paludibacter sp.]
MKRIISFIILNMALTFAVPVNSVAQSKSQKADAQIERAKLQSEKLTAQRDSIKSANEAQAEVYRAENARRQYYINLATALMAVCALGVISWKYRNSILSIVRTMTGSYRIKGDIHSLEAKKILTGAIYADQQGAYLNTLKADVGSKFYTILSEGWDINGKDTAIEKLDYLRYKGYAYYFPTVVKASKAGSDEEAKQIIISEMTTQEDAEKAYDQTCNLKESIGTMKNLNLITHEDDIEKYGVVGWDAGRLIFIARLCCDAKYITEEEAWEYIDVAYSQAQNTFNSWEELAKSYVIGRFFWQGKDADDGIQTIAENLLSSAKSPWTQVAWK